jgi:hypothetical protein
MIVPQRKTHTRIAWHLILVVPIFATEASAQLVLPNVTGPTPRVIVEDGSVISYYRRSPHVTLPWVRIGVGFQLRDATPSLAFTADVHGGVARRFERDSPWALIGELGGSYVGFSEYLASVGVGVLYGLTSPSEEHLGSLPHVRIALIPHILAGEADGRVATGLRTSVLVGVWLYAIELAHQVLWVDGTSPHEFHVVLTTAIALGEDR